MAGSADRADPVRRQLIMAAGLAPLAFTATRALGQGERRLGWAIVGLGSFAQGQVIPMFAGTQHSRLAAFVSGDPTKAARLGEQYGVSRFYSYENFDSIADNPDIDCVYIVLPVGMHAEYTVRALKAGKHVLCEKPMASTAAECEVMMAAAKAANRQLGVAYRVHFEPTNVEALRLLRAGEIGAIRHVQCDHGFNANLQFPPHKWRLEKALAGGGSMFDIGIYGLNTSLMMLEGDRPVSASAFYAYPRDDARFAEVEGGIDWRLTMASGINVQGSSSYCYSPYVSRQRYFGAEGSLTMEPATTYDNNRIAIEGGGEPRRDIAAASALTQFAAQIDGFSQAARTNTPHRAPGEMGLRDLKIIEALYESADNQGKVVNL